MRTCAFRARVRRPRCCSRGTGQRTRRPRRPWCPSTPSSSPPTARREAAGRSPVAGRAAAGTRRRHRRTRPAPRRAAARPSAARPAAREETQGSTVSRQRAKRTMKLVNAHFPDGLPYAEDERDFQLAASAQTRLPLADDAPSHRRRGFEGKDVCLSPGFQPPRGHSSPSKRQRGAGTALQVRRARAPLSRAPHPTRRRKARVPPQEADAPRRHRAGADTAAVAQAPVSAGGQAQAPLDEILRRSGPQLEVAQARRPSPTCASRPAPEAVPRNPTARPRLDWAQLLRRTWGFDVFDCPCGGRRRVLALVTHPDLARKILGFPSHPRTRPLPTGPPQLELSLD